jgi:chromosome partitioning protein
VAIANQKGGVGKSTTAVSLGAALADLGYRVLVIDLDPQGNASTGLGIRHEARDITVYNVVVSESPIVDAIVPTQVQGLHAVPSTIDLAGAEIELVSQFSREGRLKRALEPVRDGAYHFVLLDCPPSLGLLTINALTAAEELIVPIQCEYYALEGLGQLLRNVSLVQQNINPGLRLSGIVMTMFDPRTKLSEQVVDEVRRFFGDLVYDVIIPRTVRLSEAPGFGQPITVYDPRSKGAEAYRRLAGEVADRPPPDEPMPTFDDLPTVVLSPLDDSIIQKGSPQPSQAPAEPQSPGDGVSAPEPKAEVEPAGPEAVAEVDGAVGPAPRPPAEPEREPQGGASQAEVEGSPKAEAPQESVEPSRDAATRESDAPPPSRVSPPASGAERAEAFDIDLPLGEDEFWDEDASDAEIARMRPAEPATGPQERRIVVIDEDAELNASRGGRGAAPDRPSSGGKIGATLEEEKAPKRRWRLFRKGGE